VDNVNAAGDSKTTVSSLGHYNQNRIGFRGTEDLGGGYNARFVLESGWNTGTGALETSTNPTLGATRLFQRTATVGLLTPIGAVDFGRQYSVAFKAIAAYEPLGYKYVTVAPVAGAAAGSTGNGTNLLELQSGVTSAAYYLSQGGSRFDNDVQFSTRLGPVTLLAEYAFGEVAGDNSDGSAAAIGANYTAGPVTLGGAYTKKKTSGLNTVNVLRALGGAPATTAAAIAPTSAYQDNDQWTIGAAFKSGPLRVSAGYINDEQEGTLVPVGLAVVALRETQVRNAFAGVNYAISPALELSGAFYKTKREARGVANSDGTRDVLIVGATYALSKRTNFYGAIDTAKLKGDFRMVAGGRTEDRQSGVSVGVNHLF